jgi:Concanavalin A-like lectin/glucanases superfamily
VRWHIATTSKRSARVLPRWNPRSRFARAEHVTSRDPVTFGAWSHVAATADGRALRLFVDGKLQGVVPWSTWIYPGTVPLVIGSTLWGRAYFVGELDDVALYARALAVDEIATHVALGNPADRK